MHIAFLSKARKKFPILGECFLALNLLNNSCFTPDLCLQENSSRANTVQDDLTSMGGLTQQLLCAQERKNLFSCSQKQDDGTETPKSDQKERTTPFSLLVFQNRSDKTCWITWRDTEHSDGDRFMLFVVYCSLCARAAHVMRWPETRAFEDEPTKYVKRKETEVKLAAFANARAAIKLLVWKRRS